MSSVNLNQSFPGLAKQGPGSSPWWSLSQPAEPWAMMGAANRPWCQCPWESRYGLKLSLLRTPFPWAEVRTLSTCYSQLLWKARHHAFCLGKTSKRRSNNCGSTRCWSGEGTFSYSNVSWSVVQAVLTTLLSSSAWPQFPGVMTFPR